jgi:hypothetical protein
LQRQRKRWNQRSISSASRTIIALGAASTPMEDLKKKLQEEITALEYELRNELP